MDWANLLMGLLGGGQDSGSKQATAGVNSSMAGLQSLTQQLGGVGGGGPATGSRGLGINREGAEAVGQWLASLFQSTPAKPNAGGFKNPNSFDDRMI